jgi:hypothetical protein
MSVRSLRAAVRRSPGLVGAAAVSASLLLTGCGDDVVDDGVEQEIAEVEQEVEEQVDDE